MTYGTSHLLIGGGGGEYFQREGQEKILLCKGVGWGHYMKNKNIGGGGGGGEDLFCFVNST